MVSSHDLTISLPGRAYTGATVVVAALLFAFSAWGHIPLLGIVLAAFTAFVAVVAWLGYQLAYPRYVDGRPFVFAVPFVVLLLVYAALIAESILLGLLASVFSLLTALAVGVLLALSSRPAAR